MKSKALFILSLIATFVSSCGGELRNVKREKLAAARQFVDYVKVNDGEKAFEMLNRGLYKADAKGSVQGDVQTFNELAKKYGMPAERYWKVNYDTVNPYFKIMTISVPLVEESDKDQRYSTASMVMEFDHTSHFLPDTILAGYKFEFEFRPLD